MGNLYDPAIWDYETFRSHIDEHITENADKYMPFVKRISNLNTIVFEDLRNFCTVIFVFSYLEANDDRDPHFELDIIRRDYNSYQDIEVEHYGWTSKDGVDEPLIRFREIFGGDFLPRFDKVMIQ